MPQSQNRTIIEMRKSAMSQYIDVRINTSSLTHTEIQASRLFKKRTIMKKVIIAVVGGSLFIAGYHHARRQVEYMATQNVSKNPTYITSPMVGQSKANPIFALSLKRPFSY